MHLWATVASSEQDGGRMTTAQDAFPDMSIQSLATLLEYSSELYPFRVSFLNSE